MDDQYYGTNPKEILTGKNMLMKDYDEHPDFNLKKFCDQKIHTVQHTDEYLIKDKPQENTDTNLAENNVEELYVNDSFNSDTDEDIDEEQFDSDWWILGGLNG